MPAFRFNDEVAAMSKTRTVSFISLLALATLVAGALLQNLSAGFHKVPLALAGGVPATLYYQDPPGAPPDARPGFDPPPRQAGVVIAHGYSADHYTMEALSEALALAGVLLLVSLILAGRMRGMLSHAPSSLAVAAAGWLATLVLLAPASAHFHGVSLTAEKAFLALWAAACLMPFALALQCLLYRPGWWRGTLLRIGARIAILAAAGLDALVTGWLFAVYLPVIA